jgi:diguanylate cyclase (GGDEF)-like protein
VKGRVWSKVAAGLCVVGLGLGVVSSLRADSGLADGLYLGSTVCLAVALLVSAFVNRPDKWVLAGLLSIAGSSVAGQIVDNSYPERDNLQIVAELLFLVVQVVLAVGLLYIVSRRLGSDPRSVLADGSIVAAGSWFLLWLLVVQPAIDREDRSVVLTAIIGVTLAVSVVVLFTLATLLFGDSSRTPAVWFVAGAITFTLAGDFIYASIDSGRLPWADVHGITPYIVGMFMAAAAFIHPSISTLTDEGPTLPERPLLGRLIVTTSALTVPVVVLALSDPVDETDRIVRAVSMFVLAAAVTGRVVQAVRRNAVTQRQLIHAAQTDALTNLPNRSLMVTHVENSLRVAWALSTQPAVFFVDVDRFKNINDSLGHQAGDDVLVAVATRLRHALPDRCVVGRISGDEFVVLDPDNRNAANALVLAERILECFKEPLTVRQGDVFVSSSVGVATHQHGNPPNAEDLLRQADTAMYRAKDAGRNCIAVFDESMLERATQRLAVETALYRALERRELRLVHQPIVDIDLGEVVGFEALMRWEREDGSMVSPAEFIPIAEETGTIVPIGSWALLEALTHLRDWINQGLCRRDATISVNVSPRQLHDPNFTAVVAEALVRAHVPADQLWLEVTESVMISEPEQALSILRQLCDMGVRVAIDDFGTGYSSLSLLQRFPIQRIKIDRSFVSGVADELGARSLVRTIIAMGESLGLDMVAEGVESVRQLQTLAELRCAKAQGFLISHPVAPDVMGQTIAALEQFGSWQKLRGSISQREVRERATRDND